MMQHRIRAAALIIQDNRILVVEHKHPKSGFVWWVPPGGGLEAGESIFECARREVWEETGLAVELEKIVYVREFVDLEWQRHNLELFVLATSFSGTLTTGNIRGIDAEYIEKADFFGKDDLHEMTVYPEILRDLFWEDLQEGFPNTRYLGLQRA